MLSDMKAISVKVPDGTITLRSNPYTPDRYLRR